MALRRQPFSLILFAYHPINQTYGIYINITGLTSSQTSPKWTLAAACICALFFHLICRQITGTFQLRNIFSLALGSVLVILSRTAFFPGLHFGLRRFPSLQDFTHFFWWERHSEGYLSFLILYFAGCMSNETVWEPPFAQLNCCELKWYAATVFNDFSCQRVCIVFIQSARQPFWCPTTSMHVSASENVNRIKSEWFTSREGGPEYFVCLMNSVSNFEERRTRRLFEPGINRNKEKGTPSCLDWMCLYWLPTPLSPSDYNFLALRTETEQRVQR